MATNFYELTYIVDGSLAADKVQEVIQKYTKMLVDGGAEIEETNEWGNKPLAYMINKQRTGYYINQYFTAPGSALLTLERYIRLDESVFRYLVLKYDNKMKRHRELKKAGKVRTYFQPVVEAAANVK
jgi:small subunit ribosomal protein S6